MEEPKALDVGKNSQHLGMRPFVETKRTMV